jgi:hypothetical protein
MRFNVLTTLAFVATVTASAIPEMQTSPRDISPLENRSILDDTYDCKGSSMCKSLQVRACDDAVNNKIIRNDDVNYGADG